LFAEQPNVIGDKNARAFSEQLICHGKPFVEGGKNQRHFPAAWKRGSDFSDF
jgi:hypothetical protein